MIAGIMGRTETVQLIRQLEGNARLDGKEAYFRLHRHRYVAILEELRAPPGARVLEVGVNPGQFTQLLVGAGYRVSGVDLNPAPRQALWERLGVEVRQAHLEHDPLPFPDESFDWLVFSEVIEHLVYSPLPVLREFRRVLAPGGQLLITTPNELYAKSRLRAIVRMLLWQSQATRAEFRHQMLLEGDARYTTHSRTYTMGELCWLVQQAGFRIVARRYVAPWEQVGLEKGRMLLHPLRVLGKGALAGLTALIPPLRSMLLLSAQREH
jgi:SAM-dependent methyltransferase